MKKTKVMLNNKSPGQQASDPERNTRESSGIYTSKTYIVQTLPKKNTCEKNRMGWRFSVSITNMNSNLPLFLKTKVCN